MSNGNGNGEVKKLVDLKHTFKAEASQLETDLRTKFEQELAEGEKELKDKYLEQVVDWFYGNGLNGHPTAKEKEPEPPAEPAPAAPLPGDTQDPGHCTNCGANLYPGDQFCSQCATPIELPPVEVTPVAAPATAGRLVRMRPGPIPRRETADERVRGWARTRR